MSKYRDLIDDEGNPRKQSELKIIFDDDYMDENIEYVDEDEEIMEVKQKKQKKKEKPPTQKKKSIFTMFSNKLKSSKTEKQKKPKKTKKPKPPKPNGNPFADFAKKLLLTLVIFALLFMLVYEVDPFGWQKDSSGIEIPEMPEISLPSIPINEVEEEVEPETEPVETYNITDMEMVIDGYIEDELLWVREYLDVKLNRKNTINNITSNRNKKENLYEVLQSQKESMSESDFARIENKLIKSNAISMEILRAFDSNTTIKMLKDVLEKYDN